MVKSISMPRPEIIFAADALSNEKDIDKEIVFESLEAAVTKIARNKYGYEHDIVVKIDRKDGAISVVKRLEVIDDKLADLIDKEYDEEELLAKEEAGEELPEIYTSSKHIILKEAKKELKDIEVGQFIETELPPVYFGRSSFQSAKQIISGKIRGAEREKQFVEFKDKAGEIVNGVVKRVEYGNVFVEVNGKAEAVIRRNELIPREMLHVGDRVRALVLDVREEKSGPQIFLTRSHPNFMAKLFEQEIPEIFEGVIEIKGVARDAGSHSKVAVLGHDASIDAVGACVGMRGSRIQTIVNELQGEKIDIIPFSEDIAQYVINAMKPTKVSKVVVDEDTNHIDVVVAEDQLSIAIGRKGQNVRLSSQLIGWKIDVVNETDDQEKRMKEMKEKSQLFISALDIDDMMAQVLISEGFSTLEELAFVPVEELVAIEGFEQEIAEEIQNRAKTAVEKQNKEIEAKLKEMKIDDKLVNFELLTKSEVLKLAEEKEIKELDDLADLASDDLIVLLKETLDKKLNSEEAEAFILKARAHWFEGEEKAEK
ncbi:MAG: transcription termination factor NusA [Alphaproteobacteria bacterium]|jgi:N utilization substance protein A|nr:transcription termination factor NusA [Alphaproteobacteria bacterium]